MISGSDAVLALDRFQNTDDKRICQSNRSHGTLFPHKSGAYLTCGRGGCEYAEPVGTELLKAASALK